MYDRFIIRYFNSKPVYVQIGYKKIEIAGIYMSLKSSF